jgi:hypothetical protein
MAFAIRTVLDLRAASDKFISQTLLLAASWHRFCRDDGTLEVSTIGDSRPLSAFLDEVGAVHRGIPPGRNDDISKSGNKIEAAGPDPAGRRVLLLDNDTCILGRIDELSGMSKAGIAASIAGEPRVGDAQWELIRSELGLPLLKCGYTPLNHWSAEEAHEEAPPERYLYANSGVLLFPAGHDHRGLWANHQRRIQEFFNRHPLSTDAVTSSDQAALATSIAAHGSFEWLPLRFNYRPGAFRIGLETPDRIRILHFTAEPPDVAGLGLTERMLAYWQHFVLPRIEALPASLDLREKSRRREIALDVLSLLLALIRSYDLDSRFAACRSAQQQYRIA